MTTFKIDIHAFYTYIYIYICVCVCVCVCVYVSINKQTHTHTQTIKQTNKTLSVSSIFMMTLLRVCKVHIHGIHVNTLSSYRACVRE
jgi:hypothetical protein